MILVLGMALALFAVAGPSQAAIQWAGNPVIELDANDLTVGSMAAQSWANKVAGGGSFAPTVWGTPVVTETVPGKTAVSKKKVDFVRFPASGYGDNATALEWSLGAPAGITASHSFSVEGWVYMDVSGELQTFLSMGRRGADPAETVNNFAFSAGYNAAGSRAIGMATANLNWTNPTHKSGTYNYFAAVYDSGAGTMSVYVNGVLDGSMAMAPYSITTGQPLFLGGMWFNANGKYLQQGLQGGISKVRVHDGALTAEQVLANFGEEAADYFPAPVINDDAMLTTVTAVLNRAFSWGPAPFSATPRNPLVWALTTNPSGMVIDAATGVISWPNPSPVGGYQVAGTVTSPEGSDTFSFGVKVVPATPPAGIQVAGDLLINVDGELLNTLGGPVASWINLGTLGGSFKSYGMNARVREARLGPKTGIYCNGPYMELVNDSAALITAPAAITGNDDWTFEAWLKVETFAGDCQWIGWAGNNWAGSGSAALLYATAGGYPSCWIDAADGFFMGGWGARNPNPTATDAKFHHVVYTWDSATNTYNTYLDGLVGDNNVHAAGFNIGVDQKIMLGRCYDTAGIPQWSATNAIISRVRVHSGALTATQVAANYAAEQQEFLPPPVPVFALRTPVVPMMELGDIAPGAESEPQTVTFLNIGESAMLINTIRKTGDDFQILGPPADLLDPLLPGARREFQIVFAPASAGKKTGTIEIATNGSATTTTINLVGNTDQRFYLSGAGDDANNGLTAGTPVLTWAAAIGKATPVLGSVIEVANGTYDIDYFGSNGDVNKLVRVKGTASGPGEKALFMLAVNEASHFGSANGVGEAIYFEDVTFKKGADGYMGAFHVWRSGKNDYQFRRVYFDMDCDAASGGDNMLAAAHNTGYDRWIFDGCTFKRTDPNDPNTKAWNGFQVAWDGNILADCDITIANTTFDGVARPIRAYAGGFQTVRDITITKAAYNGLDMRADGEELNVANVVVDAVAGNGGDSRGILVGGSRDINVSGCTVSNCGGSGIALWAGANDAHTYRITACRLFNNLLEGGYGHIDTNSQLANPAIGGTFIDRCWVAGVNTPLVAAVCWSDSGMISVTNSVFEGSGGTGGDSSPALEMWSASPLISKVQNCTVIATEDAPGGEGVVVGDWDSAGDLTVQNCIILGYTDAISAPGAYGLSTLTADHNITDATVADPKLAFQAGAAFAKPPTMSTATSLRDYVLTTASTAAKGKGVYLGDPLAVDYSGSFRPNPPSIGAFEGPPAAPVIVAFDPSTVHAAYGQPFTLTPVLSAGYPSPVWTLDAASLARGLTIDAATGLISWNNPQPLGANTVTVTATNDSGADSKSFTLSVESIPPVTQPFDPDTYRALAGLAWEGPVPVLLAGAPAPVWTLNLEPNPSTAGITIDPATGQVSWADPAAGVDTTVTVVATTGIGSSDSASFRLIVLTEGVAPVLAPFSPNTVAAGIGAAFTGPHPTFSVEGVPSPTWSFTVDPAAAGMEINVDSGIVTWSPTEWGLYTVTVKAENSFGDSSQSYTLRVSKPTRAGNWMLYE